MAFVNLFVLRENAVFVLCPLALHVTRLMIDFRIRILDSDDTLQNPKVCTIAYPSLEIFNQKEILGQWCHILLWLS
jgi:hypothetical protein